MTKQIKKAIIDKGVALMNADGATEPNQLSSKAKKQELLSYAQEAAAVMEAADDELMDFDLDQGAAA
mgnify:CR=1 FL=1